jgi:hypothetical protein
MRSAWIDDGNGAGPQVTDSGSSGIWRVEGEPLGNGKPSREPTITTPRDDLPQTENGPGPGSRPMPELDPPMTPRFGDGLGPLTGTPAPRPETDWCPKLPEEDPQPPPQKWDADPCAPLSSEGRSEGGKWVPETPLLTDPAHPDHELFKQALTELKQPELCGRFDSEAQRERVAAAIAAEAKDAGLRRIDDVVVGKNGENFIAIEGPNPYAPESRRATVDYGEALVRSVEQSTAKITPEACVPGPAGPPGNSDLLAALAQPSEPVQLGRSPSMR